MTVKIKMGGGTVGQCWPNRRAGDRKKRKVESQKLNTNFSAQIDNVGRGIEQRLKIVLGIGLAFRDQART